MRLSRHLYQVCGRMYGSHQNVYVLEGEDGLVMIDTGRDAKDIQTIQSQLKRWHLEKPVKHVLLSHEHYEHIAMGSFWQSQQAVIYAHPEAAEAVRKGGLRTADYAFAELGDYQRFDVQEWDGTETKTLEGFEITLHHAPGHSAGSVIYMTETDGLRVMFTGDTLLVTELCHKARPGWTGGIDYDEETYVSTLRSFAGMRTDMILPGHGEVCLHRGEVMCHGAWLIARQTFLNDHAAHPLEVQNADQ